VGTLGVGVPPLPRPSDGRTRSRTGPSARPASPRRTRCCCRRLSGACSTTASRPCAIEASSIGIVEHRLAGTRVEVALFTNFTRDHLDYHGSMDAYWAAKRLLFGWVGLKAASINIDDDAGDLLAGELRHGALDLWTYSVRADAGARLTPRTSATATAASPSRWSRRPRLRAGRGARGSPHLADRRIQRSNLLAVLGGLRALGVPLADAARVGGHVTPVPGRMQRAARVPQAHPRSSSTMRTRPTRSRR
jgi:UDP-N-acetylmuramoyl-L-alanyl-D-glutamate--2,6-diaminopimelate ligase